jgi:glycosyltransferase involved in cell wall biosynthesis
MKIVFLRAYDFPLGGAPQNRLLGVCRGLINEGHEVEVHQYAPAKLDLPLNHEPNQVYKSVQIFNHAWRWSPSSNKVSQVLGLLTGYFSTIVALLKSNRNSKIDFIFMNVEKNIYIFPIYILSRLFNAKLGRDLNEYPSFILKPEAYSKIQVKYNMLTNYKWFDVLFIMTNFLKEYYKKLAKSNVRILLLPMTVDIERFPESSKDFIKSNYITYCGDLSQSKDGVLTLIQSFALMKDEFINLQLRLIGHNKDKKYMNLLQQQILQSEISDRVLLTGFINPEDVPAELYKSRLLVLARPDNIQAQGGFPTKLGEYLATGIPVVVTKVGELPLYLKDEVNAFMAEPNNILSFKDAIRRALINPNLSQTVGHNGRMTALKYFSHSEQGKMISKFLKS